MKQQLIQEWHQECKDEGNHEWEDFLIERIADSEVVRIQLASKINEIKILRECSLKANLRIEELVTFLNDAQWNLETPGN
jgi:hypothetical protein